MLPRSFCTLILAVAAARRMKMTGLVSSALEAEMSLVFA
jgi:hypothetical protein